ncbi:MAG: cytochrome P450 [Verrucomicrobiales bacterium]|nr:cytochrome P450 [Verrucomicrobiales bacterium]
MADLPLPVSWSVDPLAPGFLDDRHAGYAFLRRQHPVFLSEHSVGAGRPTWFLTRYQDVRRVLADNRFLRFPTRPSAPPTAAGDADALRFQGVIDHWLIYLDGSSHMRLRRALQRAFSKIEPTLKEVVDQEVAGALSGLAEGETADLMARYAMIVPARVMCRILGLPRLSLADYFEWNGAFLRALERTNGLTSWQEAGRAVSELEAALSDQGLARLGDESSEFVDCLRSAAELDGSTSAAAVMANIVLLLMAGFETTAFLIGNAVSCLLNHPEEAALVRQTSSCAGPAVEETLRFEPPVQVTYRSLSEAVEIGGVTLPGGAMIGLVIGSANRDESVLPAADRFTPRLQRRSHLAFGVGPHACLGAGLGRLEAATAISRLFAEFPRLRHDGTGRDWRMSLTFRALESLPVVL